MVNLRMAIPYFIMYHVINHQKKLYNMYTRYVIYEKLRKRFLENVLLKEKDFFTYKTFT